MPTTTLTSTSSISFEESNPEIIEIAEYDKAGNLKATYIESKNHSSGTSRVDVLLPTESKKLWRRVLDIFLPDGYPQSVSDDYTKYQIYDSFQAFAGAIAGMISSRAVWEGLGVGDATARPTDAMLIQIVRECMGKLATITFAHIMGTSIEAECKMYRLKADVLCDTAVLLDCLSPLFPILFRVPLLCVSSILYAAAGVAGSASKSSLSGHFARWNNLGELNAKDGSQETVISLIGNLAGTAVVACLSTLTATWISLILLLVAHLIMNWIGVRAVKMRTLNRQRANIAFTHLLDKNNVLNPMEVSEQEIIFERKGGSVLRGKEGDVIGYCDFGVSIQDLIQSLASNGNCGKTRSSHLGRVDLTTLMKVFQHQGYILWYERCNTHWSTNRRPMTKVLVMLKENVQPKQQLRAWYHALLLARQVDQTENEVEDTSDGKLHEDTHGKMLIQVEFTLEQARKTFDHYANRLKEAGWNLEVPVLETCTGSRVVCGKTQQKHS